MGSRAIVASVLTALIVTSPAVAAPLTGQLTGMDDIVVWKDTRSMNEGIDIARTRTASPQAFRGLAACFAERGSKVLVRDYDLPRGGRGEPVAYEITVLTGSAAGCRGKIPAVFYQSDCSDPFWILKSLGCSPAER